MSELGRLDILINNAGMMLLGPVENAPLEEWERMVDVNVKGLLYCAHAALPHLIAAAQDGPREVADMVNISSVAGRMARRGSRRLQLHKARRRRVQRVAAPGGDGAPRAGIADRARRGRHGAAEPQPPRDPGADERRFVSVSVMQAHDIADAIVYIVTRPRRMSINEILIRPTEQAD